ncbi:DUF6082 family protein [Streptomyces anulatus]|uniref:DUF6082 family protein n=1 Tax=Streptomyces anulatus TaxID=1892 RepID=UPI00365C8C68
MRTTTAVLAAGAAVVAVGVARLHQEQRHQKQRIDVELARIQMDWLTQVSTNDKLATTWAPEDVDPQAYMQMMSANRMLCHLRLRDTLGFVTDRQLRFYVSQLAENDAVRKYVERFGPLRAEEAAENKRAARFTALLLDTVGA